MSALASCGLSSLPEEGRARAHIHPHHTSREGVALSALRTVLWTNRALQKFDAGHSTG